MYTFTTIRDIIRAESANGVEFKNRDLVDTQDSPDADRIYESTYMKHSMDPADLLQFIDENRRYFKETETNDIIFDESGTNTEVFSFEAGVESFQERFDDVHLVECDDADGNAKLQSDLVYGIIINRYEHQPRHFLLL